MQELTSQKMVSFFMYLCIYTCTTEMMGHEKTRHLLAPVLAPNASHPLGGLFLNAGNIYHMYQHLTANRTDIVVFYLSVTFLVSVFHFCLLFIACLTECELLTSDSSIQNFHQRVTSQHSVNVNELYTKALRDYAESEYV